MDSHWYSQSVMSVSRSLSGRLSGNYLLTDTNCVWTTLWNIYMLKRLIYSSVAYNFTARHRTPHHGQWRAYEPIIGTSAHTVLSSSIIYLLLFTNWLIFHTSCPSNCTRWVGCCYFFSSARAKRINENQPEKYVIIIRQSEMNEPKINGLAADRFVCVRAMYYCGRFMLHTALSKAPAALI